MKTDQQYKTYKKPTWAPPSWLFGPVWSVLYVLIALSFGYVLILYIRNSIPLLVLMPFVLNLIANFLFTTIQFRFRNFSLALFDVLLVLGTLVWAMIAIYPYAHWVSYANTPYLLWVCFASVLQL